jgi:hypothetical protein
MRADADFHQNSVQWRAFHALASHSLPFAKDVPKVSMMAFTLHLSFGAKDEDNGHFWACLRVGKSASKPNSDMKEKMKTKWSVCHWPFGRGVKTKKIAKDHCLSLQMFLPSPMVQMENPGETTVEKQGRQPQSDHDQLLFVLIQSRPAVLDPRKLHTMLSCFLRNLHEECQPHCLFKIVESKGKQSTIKCHSPSVPFVCTALTFCAPPPCMQDTVHQFDVLKTDRDQNALHAKDSR